MLLKKIPSLFVFGLIFWLGACQTAAPAPDDVTAVVSDAVEPTLTSDAEPTLSPLAVPTAVPTSTPMTVAEPVLAFDGAVSFEYLEAQMAIGRDRYPGSEGHWQTGEYIIGELEALGWAVEEQPFTYQGVDVRNITGKANVGVGDVVIIAAHYDTRKVADQTPGAVEQGLSVPGAVDGASGVAVLLELARILELAHVPREVWLVFFDAEDNGSGGIEGWNWIVGSQYMADNLTAEEEARIEALVLVDLIGDADQQLYYEGNSDPELRETIWEIAADLGYSDVFVPQVRHTMIDDHLPFVRKGITAIDIIDFDYPYWHTVEDTADKASAESLARVGLTIEYWLESYLE